MLRLTLTMLYIPGMNQIATPPLLSQDLRMLPAIAGLSTIKGMDANCTRVNM